MEFFNTIWGYLVIAGVPAAIALLLQGLVQKLLKSKNQKKLDQANALKASVETERLALGLTAEEIQAKHNQADRAWKEVGKLEDIVDSLRLELEKVSEELSKCKIDIIKIKEAYELSEIRNNRYKNLIRNIIRYAQKNCPDHLTSFNDDYPCFEEFEKEEDIKIL